MSPKTETNRLYRARLQGASVQTRVESPGESGRITVPHSSLSSETVTQGKVAWSAKLSPEALDVFARRRELRRNGGSDKRLTFDCFHAKLQHWRVVCGQGYSFPCRDGAAGVLPVLKGACLAPCQACDDWDDGDT